MKKTLSFLLSLVMVMGIVASVPVTVNGAMLNDLKFKLNADGASYAVTDCDENADGEIIIPDVYKGLPVTVIDYGAFRSCINIISITIPDSVTSIGDYAFFECDSLASITIPDGVTSIGDYTFSHCSILTSITIPYGVTSIGDYAFCDCRYLTSIIMPDSVTSIGDHAFYACRNFTSITIPDSVTSIGDYAFSACNSLISITIPDGVTGIGGYTFSECNSLASITIPDSVKSIGDYAFYGCISLASITIPDSVTSIGNYAFYDCRILASVTIPHSVTSIGDCTFKNCTALIELNVDKNNLYYSSYDGVLFDKNKTTLIQYPAKKDSDTYKISDSVTSISGCAFYNGGRLVSITIPDSVISIGDFAFWNCRKLISITIPDSVISIGKSAFSDCKSLSTINISDNVKSIGEDAFYKTAYYNDKNNWENNVIYIDNHIIEAKKRLKGAYTIKDGTKTIADKAFGDCFSLTSITIPDGLISIGNSAFYNCTSLTSINVNENNSIYSSGAGVLFNKNKTTLIKYPLQKSDTTYTIPSSVTSIQKSSFRGCKNLVSVVMPDTVTSIGAYAFYGNKDLKYVFYSGSESDWKKIKIQSQNTRLTNAKIHYNSTGHTASKWITTKKATVNAAGSKYQKCTVCGVKIKTEKIAQLKCAAPKLKAVSNVATGIKLTWNKVTGADNYEIYRKTGNGAWKKLATVKGTVTTYTDKTAKSGTTYKYTVKAKNEAGLSKYNTTGLTIKCLADPVLKNPTSTKKGITIKWNKVTGAQGYVVYRKAGNGKLTKLATVKGVSKVTYTDKKAKKGVKYTYQIKAYSGKTFSAYSNAKTIKDKY